MSYELIENLVSNGHIKKALHEFQISYLSNTKDITKNDFYNLDVKDLNDKDKTLYLKIMRCLGDSRSAHSRTIKYFRDNPSNKLLIYYIFTALARGKLAHVLEKIRSVNFEDEKDPETRSELCTSYAYLLSLYRDFEKANYYLELAKNSDNNEWVRLIECSILQNADKREEALEKVESIITDYPRYSAAIISKAHLLNSFNRQEQAIEILRIASN